MTFAGDYPVRGTVRYIGEDKDSNGQIRTIVGLELVCLTVSCYMYVYNRLLMPIVQHLPLKVLLTTVHVGVSVKSNGTVTPRHQVKLTA